MLFVMILVFSVVCVGIVMVVGIFFMMFFVMIIGVFIMLFVV